MILCGLVEQLLNGVVAVLCAMTSTALQVLNSLASIQIITYSNRSHFISCWFLCSRSFFSRRFDASPCDNKIWYVFVLAQPSYHALHSIHSALRLNGNGFTRQLCPALSEELCLWVHSAQSLSSHLQCHSSAKYLFSLIIWMSINRNKENQIIHWHPFATMLRCTRLRLLWCPYRLVSDQANNNIRNGVYLHMMLNSIGHIHSFPSAKRKIGGAHAIYIMYYI